jgi:hypothetical protein
MVVLYAARHRLAVPALARWLLVLGIVATLAANVAHGWPDGPIGAAVAAWPAVSLVRSYELLLWLVRTAAAGAVASEPAADLSLGAGWAAGPGRFGAHRMHRVSGNEAVGWSLVDGAGVISEDREEDINVAAVAAYRTSIEPAGHYRSASWPPCSARHRVAGTQPCGRGPSGSAARLATA